MNMRIEHIQRQENVVCTESQLGVTPNVHCCCCDFHALQVKRKKGGHRNIVNEDKSEMRKTTSWVFFCVCVYFSHIIMHNTHFFMRVIKEEEKKSVKRHLFMFTKHNNGPIPDWKIVKAPNICVYTQSSWCKVAEKKTLVERESSGFLQSHLQKFHLGWRVCLWKKGYATSTFAPHLVMSRRSLAWPSGPFYKCSIYKNSHFLSLPSVLCAISQNVASSSQLYSTFFDC